MGRGPWTICHGRGWQYGGRNDDVLGEAGVSYKGSAGYDSADHDLVLNDLKFKVRGAEGRGGKK